MYWAGRRISHAPFHGAAYRLIRRQIHTGSALPGEQLPAERRLAETLGISRATLRDALKLLEKEGYVISARGNKGGNFIAGEDQINAIAREYFMTHADEVWRSMEFLRAVLSQACILACGRRNPADLAHMRTAVQDMAAALNAGQFRKAQFDFLTSLCRATLNPHLTEGTETALEGLFSPNPGPSATAASRSFDTVLSFVTSADDRNAARATETILQDMTQNILEQMMERESQTTQDQSPRPEV